MMNNKYKNWTLALTIFALLFQFHAHAGIFMGATAPPEAGGIIRGVVTTSEGKAAAGVTVTVRGTKRSTQTDDNGHFVLHISSGEYILDVSLVGYETSTENVTVTDGQTAAITLQLSVSQKQLAEIIVTGDRNKLVRSASPDLAKVPLKNLENSQVYSNVTKELMMEQSVYTQDDALKNVPGVSQLWAATDRAGFGNGSAFVLRGFELNTYLRNGVPGAVGTTIDNANIESVEVLKGPSATLFGSVVTSYGGMINRITKKPFDGFGGEVSYTGGSYGFNRLSADVNSPLDSAHNVLLG
jgi:iron complex outermembrane receptor protein